MIRKLIVSNSFNRAYKNFVKKHPRIQESIDRALTQMEKNLYNPKLKTHKLSGVLFGLIASSCGYNCRIIFRIIKNSASNKEEIQLIDIGTHETVY